MSLNLDICRHLQAVLGKGNYETVGFWVHPFGFEVVSGSDERPGTSPNFVDDCIS